MTRAVAFAFIVACGGSRDVPVASVTVAPLPPPPVTATVEVATPPPSVPTANASAAPEVLAPGKVTLVHFFASWCEPCKKSLPELDAIYKRHSGRLAVVAIGEDDDEGDMRAFVTRVAVVYTVLWDGAKAKASRWRPMSMPSTYVVDKRGSTRFTHAGYHDGEDATLESEVQSLLAESP